MSEIRSKNLFDVLGNDQDEDPQREPEPPVKAVDKPVQRSGKRNAGADAPSGGAPRGGGAARGGRGNDDPLRMRPDQRDDGVRQDRHANRTREPREHRGSSERGRGRARGDGAPGRGYSGRYTRTNRDDRQNHSGIQDNEKQAAHGWGDEKDGNNEWNDEKAGDAIARAEVNNEPGFTPDTSGEDPAFSNGPGAPGEVLDEGAAAEPENNTKSYDQYLAEQAEKRLALGDSSLAVRKANEGSKQKFPEGSAFSRNPEEENFIVGSGGKSKQSKGQQSKKETLELDGQYYAPPDAGDRGGRGRGRGGRGRGEYRSDRGGDRGDRGERPDRGERGDRGDRGDRGGRGGRGRGEYRANRGSERGGSRGGFNANDSSAFPALGA